MNGFVKRGDGRWYMEDVNRYLSGRGEVLYAAAVVYMFGWLARSVAYGG
jgi:hypothetical protein